jgi:thiamine biosynthesis lipoprotein
LRNAAIATSSAAATQRKGNVQRLGPPASATSPTEESAYSVVAPTCLLADALTKVLVQVGNSGTGYFARFGATAFVTSGGVIEGRAA